MQKRQCRRRTSYDLRLTTRVSPPQLDNLERFGKFEAGILADIGQALADAILEVGGAADLGVVVAQSGDPVPGAPGETFASFSVAASNSDGSVAFTATSDAGTRGVFLAAPQAAHVPSVSPAGLAVLATLLGLLGMRSRRA